MAQPAAFGLDPFVEVMGRQPPPAKQTRQVGTKRQASAPSQRRSVAGSTGRRIASAGAAQMRGNAGVRRASQVDGATSLDDKRVSSAGRLRPLRAVQSAKERRSDRPGSATPTMETYTRELFGDGPDSMGAWTPRMDQIDGMDNRAKTATRTPLRPSATTNHTFTQNVGLVKPMESGIDLGAPDAHSLSLLRTHELEMERVMGTIEALRRTCDDERAAKKEAQAEAKRLRTEMATMVKGRDGDSREEDKLRRRVTQLEKQLDLTKSKYSTSCEHARELSNGLADSQRNSRQLEKACRRAEELLKRSENERAELTAQLREATQARHSLANRLEKVVPAYAAAKENWGQQKRELVRHVEHYRKASLRSQSINKLPPQVEQELDEQQRHAQPTEVQHENEVGPAEESSPHGVHGDSPQHENMTPRSTDVVAQYAMTKEPNYQLMAYVNELALENQQLKQLTTEHRGSEKRGTPATPTTVEAATDMSQDAAGIVTTCTAGTQTEAATVHLAVPAYGSPAGKTADAADANILLEQLQQQLEEQLAHEQSTAAAELQNAEANQAAIAAAVERDSVAAQFVSALTNEVLSESVCRAAQAEDEDPYTSPEDDYEESSEEDQQERSAEGAAEYYGHMLSGDSSCVSPEHCKAATVAPTPPMEARHQDTQSQGLAGSLKSPPVSAPRAPAVGRTVDVQQKQLGVTGTLYGSAGLA